MFVMSLKHEVSFLLGGSRAQRTRPQTHMALHQTATAGRAPRWQRSFPYTLTITAARSLSHRQLAKFTLHPKYPLKPSLRVNSNRTTTSQ